MSNQQIFKIYTNLNRSKPEKVEIMKIQRSEHFVHENYNFLPSSIASKNSSEVLMELFKDVKVSPTFTNSLISDISFGSKIFH